MEGRTLSAVRILLLIPLSMAVSACPGGNRGGGGGGGTPATTANVLLSFKNGWTANTSCSTRQILWRFEPLTLTGSDGKATSFDVSKDYTARLEPEVHPTGGSGFRCYYDDGTAARGLRTGKWRITMDPAAGGPKCEEQLAAGGTVFGATPI